MGSLPVACVHGHADQTSRLTISDDTPPCRVPGPRTALHIGRRGAPIVCRTRAVVDSGAYRQFQDREPGWLKVALQG
ncbi:hypothetical protein JCM9533A_15800 [Catenuloplanes niger JCM 9533]